MRTSLQTGAIRQGVLLACGYGAVGFFVLFPILWILLMSFKEFKDIISYPPRFLFQPTLADYRDVLFGSEAERAAGTGSDFVRYLLNSIVISGGAVLLSALLGIPAAYALSQRKMPAAKHIRFTFLSFRFAPELSIILPLYVIYTRIGAYDTYLGMILVHQLITLPLIVLITTGFFREVPADIAEAAQIDGAGIWTILLRIVLPITRPGIASAMIIAFIFSWNNLIFGLVLTGGATRTATMGILQAMTFDQIRWGLMAAAAMVAAVPGMIVAFAMQRHITRGLTLGAIK